jgi:hypothetical protein
MARYLAPFNPELVELDPVLLEEVDVGLRIRLRAQVPGLAKKKKVRAHTTRARKENLREGRKGTNPHTMLQRLRDFKN